MPNKYTSGATKARGNKYTSGAAAKGGGGMRGPLDEIGGFFGNLGGDIAATSTGLFPGIWEQGKAAEHDIEELVGRAFGRSGQWGRKRRKHKLETPAIVAQMADAYAKQYGAAPWTKDFWERQYKHPLQPILDAASIAALGAGAATKTGLLKIAPRQKMLKTPGGGVIPGKVLSQRPLRRGAQVLGEKIGEKVTPLGQRLPERVRPSEFHAAGRERRLTHETRAAGQSLKMRPWQKAFKKLSTRERVALSILGRVPKLEDLPKWQASLPPDAPIHAVLRDPEIVKLYRNPSAKMLNAHAAGGALGEEAAAILKRLGALTDEAAEARPYLHSRVMSGAKFEPEFGKAEDVLPDYAGEQGGLFSGEFGEANRDPSGFGVGAWVRASDRPGEAANLGRITSYDPNSEWVTVHFYNRTNRARADVTVHRDNLRLASEGDVGRNVPMVLKGGKDIEELRGEIASADRPQPIYMRDTAIEERSPGPQAGTGAGQGVPKSPVKQSQAVLFKMGQLALKPDQLGPAFMRSVVYEHKRGLHDSMIADGIKTPIEEGLRPGNVWVRRGVGEKQRPERIGYIETTKGQFEKETGALKDELDIEDNAPNLEDVTDEELLADDFTTDRPEEAHVTPDGYRVQIPKSYAKTVTGEFARSNNVARVLLVEPTKFWRALVLNARPAWLVNNIIGNSVLFAASMAGEGGIKAAVKQAVRRGELDEAFVNEFWPEHSKAGTLLGSQVPDTGRFGKVTTVMGAGLAPVDKAYEAFLRRSGLEAVLKRSPAVKARLEAMPAETRSFQEAARAELNENPMLIRHASQEVSDALGNYFSMSDFERRYIRSLLPFYGWYRAITTIMLKYPLNHPIRAAILTNLGRIGDERSRDLLGPVPSYLRGAIPLGGDTLLKTQGMNAYATPQQLVHGATEDVGQLGINPFIAGAARTFGKRQPWEDPSSLFNLPGDIWMAAGAGLPETKLIQALRGKAPPSRLYEDAGWQAELRQFLGVPIRRYNRTRAAQLAREGK